jgi:DNA-binding transcriptional MocR family regulator
MDHPGPTILQGATLHTIEQAMTELQVSFPTASKAITQLETMGLLHEVSGRKRDRQFCARDILGRISALSEETADRGETP